jgi:hypothetical protein
MPQFGTKLPPKMPQKCHLKIFIEASDATASIDGQGLSADEGCVHGGQERDGLCNLVRPTWPSERMYPLALLQVFQTSDRSHPCGQRYKTFSLRHRR